MNIVVPVLGPRLLLQTKSGITLLELLLKRISFEGRYIFIVDKQTSKDQLFRRVLDAKVEQLPDKDHQVILLPTQYDKCAITVHAFKHIENDDPLAILTSSHYFVWNHDKFLEFLKDGELHGALAIAKRIEKVDHPTCDLTTTSMLRFVSDNGDDGKFVPVGIYYWTFGFDYVRSLRMRYNKMPKAYNNEQLSKHDIRFPLVYNYALELNRTILAYHVHKAIDISTVQLAAKFITSLCGG